MTMQSKIESLSAPVAVAMSSGFLSVNFWADEGLPFLAILTTVILGVMGIIGMYFNIKIKRIQLERERLEVEALKAG